MATAHRNPALATLTREINERWPDRDRTSDGWIGDAAHQATNSQHNPDPDGSVDAIDIDVDGINVQMVLNAAIKHEATQNVIYNRRITSRSYSGGLGTWHPYNGKNPHDKHIHVDTRESRENSTKSWLPPIRVEQPTTDRSKRRMYILAREEGTPEVFIGDGIHRRHIKDENELAGVKWWLNRNGFDTTVHIFKPGTIGVLGVPVS